ncbi:carotenoid oxygenase family protein [Streptomyces sp. NPDC000594]|uniref:carotenoid oxygenase family protein n=1 Tax=Streptomyces sp. NPDC000594 TaxID=3154261 RepID=UPI003333B3D2
MSEYLRGRWTPVREERTVEWPEVTGRLPPELDGTFVQIGPNPIAPPRILPYLFLIADGMVHGVRIRDGRAEWYRNRWIRRASVSRRLGEPRVPRTPGGKMLHDNPNTKVIRLAGMNLALAEAGCLPALLSDELSTLGYTDLGGVSPGFSAHPSRDPATGELHAVAYTPGKSAVRYLVVGAEGGLLRSETIEMPGYTPVMHSLALTERHVVLLDLPVRVAPSRLLLGRMPVRWDARAPGRIGVLPKHGGAREVRWFEVPPCYVYHTVNAVEEDGRIVLDAIRYPSSFAVDRILGVDGEPLLWRWTLDLATGTVREEQLDDRIVEFPQIDERYTGRPYRYSHVMEAARGTGLPQFGERTRLSRRDHRTGATESHAFADGGLPTEGVFVPRSPDAPEGDGWILAFVLSPETGLSRITVLDSQDFSGEPVAEIKLPVRVPHGFHSSWLPAD